MRQFMISAAAIAALLVSVPANAIDNHGPKQVGDKCFTPAHQSGRDLAFGTWGPCPQPASVSLVKPGPKVISFENCEQLAIQRGVPHGQTGHSEFVQQCMGQRPKGRTTG
jgi:hypothetical protein